MRKTVTSLAVAGLLSIGTAAPALARHGGNHRACPQGWQAVSVASQPAAADANEVDRNNNGTVCRKNLRNNTGGNTGLGFNLKDDRRPRTA